MSRWQDQALCAQTTNDPWFLDEIPQNKRDIEYAKSICRLCPVTNDCLEHALFNDERFGIWGATTAKERERLRKKRRIPRRLWIEPCGTPAAARRHHRNKEPLCFACREAEIHYKRRQRETK